MHRLDTKSILLSAALLAALLCPALMSAAEAQAAHAETATGTIWPTSGWQVSSPEAQGMDSGALAALVDTIGTTKQDSLLIVRHGRIVLEAYYSPYRAGIRHDLRSVTKSIVSTLTAIEIQNGLLDSVDHPVIDLFPDQPIANVDEHKKEMTVQNLLDMRSGIEWREKNYTPDESIMRMYKAPNPTAFVLDQPMAYPPGTHFQYNGGNPYVLSAIITRLTGHNAFDFAKQALFGPLGIADVTWRPADAQGVTTGESGLFLTPRDMAKIGYLYLHDGVWEGRQIIPAVWAERARHGKAEAELDIHYANLWWSLPDKHAYMAMGRHSQVILVLPDQDIVAAMTGHLPDNEFYSSNKLVDQITGAVRSGGPLAEDTAGLALLAAAIQRAATERAGPVAEMPGLAKDVSGKTYSFSDNRLHVKTLLLNLTGSNPSWEITTEGGRPGDGAKRFFGPLGVDGRFRTGPSDNDSLSMTRGQWVSKNRFSFDGWVLGHGETQAWDMTFDGRQVDVRFESTDGQKANLHGVTTD